MLSGATDRAATLRTMISKVPEVTAFFWIIKILCTTVGETAADYLNTMFIRILCSNAGKVVDSCPDAIQQPALTDTTIMGLLLAAVLVWQFRLRRYVPGVYWLAVVLISVVGTLITDNLVNNFGVSLWTTTLLFSVILAAVFALWYRSEKTLSIHSILSTRRETFYWLAVLFTFALGTAAGDLVAEGLALGYWKSALMFAGVIGLVALAHVYLRLGGILAFWIAYILTRPLGASIGDYLSQDTDAGGLALGTLATSALFLVAILAVVIYLGATRRDQIRVAEAEERAAPH
ncbi:hypothetical protein [Deinococcus sp.]|uniref:COG4705 family protein n=1 Tax=Deinococcus sp. TaxID=47478 RepID=UPI003C7C7B7A